MPSLKFIYLPISLLFLQGCDDGLNQMIKQMKVSEQALLCDQLALEVVRSANYEAIQTCIKAKGDPKATCDQKINQCTLSQQYSKDIYYNKIFTDCSRKFVERKFSNCAVDGLTYLNCIRNQNDTLQALVKDTTTCGIQPVQGDSFANCNQVDLLCEEDPYRLSKIFDVANQNLSQPILDGYGIHFGKDFIADDNTVITAGSMGGNANNGGNNGNNGGNNGGEMNGSDMKVGGNIFANQPDSGVKE
jgi:hypothetical protein